MSINFTCPNCHQEIEADDSFQGMEANCPSCDTKLIVPVPNSSQIPRDDERECPFCGEIIKKKAIICRFCKEKLDGSSIVNNGYQPEEAQSASKEDTDGGNGKTEDIFDVHPKDSAENKEQGNGCASTPEDKKGNTSKDWKCCLLFLVGGCILLWLGWMFVTGCPRLAFWILAPIVGCVIYCNGEKLNKVVVAILSAVIFLWGFVAHRHSNGLKLDFNNPKAVAQMSIDSIMNEDYQLYLKIQDPSTAESLRSTLGKVYKDPEREYFDFTVEGKHDTRIGLWSDVYKNMFKEVEYKIIKMEIKDNSEFEEMINGKKNIRFKTIITFEILNYTPEANYPKLKLPQFGEAETSIWVEQQSDGKWKVWKVADPRDAGAYLRELAENCLRDAGY